jgi:hypothetical protein
VHNVPETTSTATVRRDAPASVQSKLSATAPGVPRASSIGAYSKPGPQEQPYPVAVGKSQETRSLPSADILKPSSKLSSEKKDVITPGNFTSKTSQNHSRKENPKQKLPKQLHLSASGEPQEV